VDKRSLQLLQMIWNPLIECVGKHQINSAVGRPIGRIGELEARLRQTPSRLGQHRRRIIEPEELRVRKAQRQQLGGIARSTAQIDHRSHAGGAYLREQITRRSSALVLELQIAGRRPVAPHALDRRPERGAWAKRGTAALLSVQGALTEINLLLTHAMHLVKIGR
jgi:hypothetical protein